MAGNLVQQLWEIYVSGTREEFDLWYFGIVTGVQRLFAWHLRRAILRLEGINKGRGSYVAIFRQMVTKFQKGQIHNVSCSTALKMFVGAAIEENWWLPTQIISNFIVPPLAQWLKGIVGWMWGFFAVQAASPSVPHDWEASTGVVSAYATAFQTWMPVGPSHKMMPYHLWV